MKVAILAVEFSSSMANFARAMRGHILKLPNFPALGNLPVETNVAPPSELTITTTNASSAALQQIALTTSNSTADKKSGGKNKQSPTYYSLEDTSPDSLITAPPEKSTQSW